MSAFYSKYFSNLCLSIGAGPVFFIRESTMVCIGDLLEEWRGFASSAACMTWWARSGGRAPRRSWEPSTTRFGGWQVSVAATPCSASEYESGEALGHICISAWLMEHGYAQVMTIPPNVKNRELFLKLQREARGAGRGLWR